MKKLMDLFKKVSNINLTVADVVHNEKRLAEVRKLIDWVKGSDSQGSKMAITVRDKRVDRFFGQDLKSSDIVSIDILERHDQKIVLFTVEFTETPGFEMEFHIRLDRNFIFTEPEQDNPTVFNVISIHDIHTLKLFAK